MMMEIEPHLADIEPQRALDRIDGPPTDRIPALLVVVWPLKPDGFLALVSNQVNHTRVSVDEITLNFSDYPDRRINIDSEVRGYTMGTGRTPPEAIANAIAALPKDGTW